MVDGGFVGEAIKRPRGKGMLAVRAVWTGIGISLRQRAKPILHQIKNDLFVGTWKVIGIESHSKVPRETIVIVEPDEVTEQTINSGDILILGRGAVSKYAVNPLELKLESTQAVEVGEDRLSSTSALLPPSRRWRQG